MYAISKGSVPKVQKELYVTPEEGICRASVPHETLSELPDSISAPTSPLWVRLHLNIVGSKVSMELRIRDLLDEDVL